MRLKGKIARIWIHGLDWPRICWSWFGWNNHGSFLPRFWVFDYFGGRLRLRRIVGQFQHFCIISHFIKWWKNNYCSRILLFFLFFLHHLLTLFVRNTAKEPRQHKKQSKK